MTHPGPEEWKNLIDLTKSQMPLELGQQAWYLLIAATLSASPKPELLSQFFTYLVKNDETFKTRESENQLSLHLRDILLKQVTLVGAPQVLMAMTPLAAAEGNPQDKAKESQTSAKWNNTEHDRIYDRGLNTIHSIYGHDLLHNRIFPQWGQHTKDVQSMVLYTVYGLYLSDFEQLSSIETELVVFTTISCLGLGLGPALWHLRGLGRLLGARGDDDNTAQLRKVKDALRGLKVAIIGVVEFVGEEYLSRAKVDTWPNVGDVVRVLGGWGEDA